MFKSNHLISLTMLASLALSGCGTDQTKKESNRSTTTTTQTEQDPTKGSLGLRMPKNDKRPYAKLEITLERESDCYGYADGGEPEPYPMPEPTPDIEETRDVGAPVAANLHSEEYDCAVSEVAHYAETFEYKEGAEVSMPNVVPGNYSITVRLLGAGGEAIEEGHGWAYVSPGVVTQAVVELYPTGGNGQLDILIVRGGDRVDHNKHDLDDDYQCAPSAYVEDGNVKYGECYNGAGPSAEDRPETGSAK